MDFKSKMAKMAIKGAISTVEGFIPESMKENNFQDLADKLINQNKAYLLLPTKKHGLILLDVERDKIDPSQLNFENSKQLTEILNIIKESIDNAK